jgi:hypothetical protein
LSQLITAVQQLPQLLYGLHSQTSFAMHVEWHDLNDNGSSMVHQYAYQLNQCVYLCRTLELQYLIVRLNKESTGNVRLTMMFGLSSQPQKNTDYYCYYQKEVINVLVRYEELHGHE